jgi:RimJ/RimL family protein N-acetyltransferase
MIKIEMAQMEDVEVITEIKERAYNDETRRFGPGRDGGPQGYDSVESTRWLMNKFSYYKIMIGREVIGGFWLEGWSDGQLQLEDFCIHPQHHNKGYGTMAIKLMEEMFPNIKKWTLKTPHYSLRNQHLYKKMGYVKIGESEDKFLFLYEKEK